MTDGGISSMKPPFPTLALVVALWFAGRGFRFAQAEPASTGTESEPVTFNRHIAPILFRRCVACHRPGEVAPFSLLTYSDSKKRAAALEEVTSQHVMPPWKSVDEPGRFLGEGRLTESEIELFSRWANQGAPEGVTGDLPNPPRFTEGWKLGQPDLVLTMPEAFRIPAEGRDIYRNFVFQLQIPLGKYIKAVEFRPSNRRLVHHAQLCLDTTRRARVRDDTDPLPGYDGSGKPPGQLFPGSLATWTPGRDPLPLPEGMSMPWPDGADLVVQLHLHPNGKPETEQSSIGFYFTDQPPRRSMADILLLDMKIDIPPGEPSYRTWSQIILPIDVEVIGAFPHMHLLGREFKLTAYPQEGKPVPMLWIRDWDFNWQVYYQYTVPLKLTAGTRVVMEAVHDNSAGNIHNPNHPPRRVTGGEETTDEMSVAFLQVMPVREEDFPNLGLERRGFQLGVIRANSPDSDAKNAGAVRSQSTLPRAVDFVGNWEMQWQGAHGHASFSLSVENNGHDLDASLTKEGVPQQVHTISVAGHNLTLAVTLESGGATFPANLTLTSAGDTAGMRIVLSGGLADLHGTARRKHQE
jgi:hypothetical protein